MHGMAAAGEGGGSGLLRCRRAVKVQSGGEWSREGGRWRFFFLHVSHLSMHLFFKYIFSFFSFFVSSFQLTVHRNNHKQPGREEKC